MIPTTLVLPSWIADTLAEFTAEPLESAGVLLVGVAGSADGSTRLLGREFHPVPLEAYLRREPDGLTIAPEGYVEALRRAEEIGASALWFHTHPGKAAAPQPSEHDRVVDQELAPVFMLRTGGEIYGSLIVSGGEGEIRFSGHIATESSAADIERIWIVGDRFRLLRSDATEARIIPEIFDRNVRAFGGPVQRVLRDLRVAIVGCGGTGSAVAEQLVRLGVRELILIDPDVLSDSNITRVYGSTQADIGRSKVIVLAEHLRRIAPDSSVRQIASTVTVEAGARELTACDVIFGCTDDNAGRLVLSRFSTYFLTPVIDCGVLLSSTSGGQLVGIDARVTVLAPGAACLVCRGRVDLARAATELLTPEERRQREDEGYAAALPGVEPAVVTYTSLAAAVAVGELLERLIGYGPDPVPSEVLVRCHDREISTNLAAPQRLHFCDPAAGKLGIGETAPFLEKTWTA